MTLTEATDAREQTRAKLLELRARLSEHQRLAQAIAKEVSELEPQIRIEERRLIEWTTKMQQLLNADVSGLLGRRAGSEPAELPTRSELTQQPDAVA
jgi:hypothetical protein